MEAIEMLKIALRALDDKKGSDVQAIRVEDLTTLTDYFAICSGSSSTQVRALAEEVEEKLSLAGVEPNHIEGRSTSWILLDYGSLVVHVFYRDAREFYQLERLWLDGEQLDVTELLSD